MREKTTEQIIEDKVYKILGEIIGKSIHQMPPKLQDEIKRSLDLEKANAEWNRKRIQTLLTKNK